MKIVEYHKAYRSPGESQQPIRLYRALDPAEYPESDPGVHNQGQGEEAVDNLLRIYRRELL